MLLKDVRLCFDVDGVVCDDADVSLPYSERPVLEAGRAKIRHLKQQGAIIVFHTARYMNKYNGDQRMADRHGWLELKDWLEQREVPWDEIYFGKPSAAIYVDDRGCRVQADNWSNLEQLLFEDPYGCL